MIGCGKYSEGQWSEYLFGETSAHELVAHLEQCPVCNDEISELQATEAVLRSTPLSHPVVGEVFTSRVLASVAERPSQAAEAGPTQSRISRWSLSSLGTGSLVAAACLLVVLIFSGLPGSDPSLDESMSLLNDPAQTGLTTFQSDEPVGLRIFDAAGDADLNTLSIEMAMHPPVAAQLSVPDGVSRPVDSNERTADSAGPPALPMRESFGITMALP